MAQCFYDWHAEKKVLEDIPVEELEAVLCKFYAEVRRKDGEEYEPDSLAIIQASLDRHLENVGRPYSTLRDNQFQLFSYYPNSILVYNIINT